jgi:predicted ATPase/DNA-binding CsgD family transcriptional regulator
MGVDSPLVGLADRELATLALIADGLSNEAIAGRLHVSVRTVEAVCATIFRKLDLAEQPETNRRVRAAVLYVNHARDIPDELTIPHRWTSFVGRGNELDDLCRLLENHRWLTIIGPGGSGKTSLAIALAAGNLRARGRARFVDLVPVRTPDGVVDAVCDSFGVAARNGRVGLRRVRQLIGDDPLLLVIDNADPLREPVTAVIGELAPLSNLTTVVTSRSPLRSPDEHVWVIPPLRIGEAEQLLRERAAFALDDEAAAAICSAADGMPLAIELAATRIDAIGVDQVVARLGDLPSLLTLRGSTDRHASIASALELSYTGLDPDAQHTFRTLALLPGGFTLETARRCVDFADADRVADVLEALVGASLVSFTGERYRMLEPVRQYGADLDDDAERRRARRRFVTWAVEWGGHAGKHAVLELAHWSPLLQREDPNLTAAIDVACVEGWIDDALRLVGRLGFWWTAAHYATHLSQALHVLDSCDGGETPRQLGWALVTTANLGLMVGRGDHDWDAMFERAITLLEESNDDVGLGAALFWHAYHTSSLANLDRAITIAEQTGNDYLLGWSLYHTATSALQQGRPINEQLPLLERAESVAQRSGLSALRAASLMGRAACYQLEPATQRPRSSAPRLRDMADEADTIMRQSGKSAPTTLIHELVFLQARLRLVDHDLDAAERYVVEAIGIGAICESRPILGEALALGAALMELRGHDDNARRLIELRDELTTQPRNPQWNPLLPANTRRRLASPATDALHPLVTDKRFEAIEAEALDLLRQSGRDDR